MADDVKGITVLKEFLSGIKMLSDEQRGKLFLALFADSGCCDMPEMDMMTRMVFELVIPSVRKFQDAYERQRAINSENGKKGGRPRKNQPVNIETDGTTEKPIGFDENQSVISKSEDETEKPTAFSVKSEKPTELNGTEPNGIKETVLLTPSIQDTPRAPETPDSWTPPTVADVDAYCRQIGSRSVDPHVFVGFFGEREWKTKDGGLLRDWRAMVRAWEDRRSRTRLSRTEERDAHNDRVCEEVREELRRAGRL